MGEKDNKEGVLLYPHHAAVGFASQETNPLPKETFATVFRRTLFIVFSVSSSPIVVLLLLLSFLFMSLSLVSSSLSLLLFLFPSSLLSSSSSSSLSLLLLSIWIDDEMLLCDSCWLYSVWFLVYCRLLRQLLFFFFWLSVSSLAAFPMSFCFHFRVLSLFIEGA